jgi:hypothetical protein
MRGGIGCTFEAKEQDFSQIVVDTYCHSSNVYVVSTLKNENGQHDKIFYEYLR